MSENKKVQILSSRQRNVLDNNTFRFFNEQKEAFRTTMGQSAEINFSKVSYMNIKSNVARLCKPGAQAKDQKWFISYNVYDAAKGKRVRMKEYEVNKIVGIKNRERYAAGRIRELNMILSEGVYINSAESKLMDSMDRAKKDHMLLKLSEVAEYFLAYQKRKDSRSRTIIEYGKTIESFMKWCSLEGLYDPLFFMLKREAVEKYLDYLKDDRKLSARTRNNHLGVIKTLFNYAYKELHPDDVKISPIFKIKKMPISMGRNIAFNDEQIKELTSLMREKFPNQLFLCQFLYYTLARPNEIAQLKVKHIGMGRDNCIFIPAEVAKNRQNRYVEITPALDALLKSRGIYEANPEYYIFSENYLPGPKPKNPKTLGRRFTVKVLKRLGYSSDYTLYSWKHTGVSKAYKAGLTQAAIQMQMGHTNTASFQAYIKSLSLLENNEFSRGMPEL